MAFNKKSKILQSTNVELDTRKQLLKTFVWSIILYGCETWTISESDKNALEAFEMWCFRKMLRIVWTDHVTNETVLNNIGEKRSIITVILKRKAQWIGHVIRHDCLLHTILEGAVAGENRRGRPRQEFLDSLIKDLKFTSYTSLKIAALERTTWRRMCQSLQTNRTG